MSPSGQPHAGSAGTVSGGAEFSSWSGSSSILGEKDCSESPQSDGDRGNRMASVWGWGGAAAGKQHLPLAQACPSCHDSCPQELWSLLQARLYLHNRKSNVWSLPNTRAMSQRWKVGKRGFDLLAGGCLRRSLGQALVLEQCLSLSARSVSAHSHGPSSCRRPGPKADPSW